ncbi:hypothetical protein DL770_000788 [Monosporascus sp. CRB-9-2]|nr:hypothetical protein DL770_000788 [Monosporascus sp. CRB-9-2]
MSVPHSNAYGIPEIAKSQLSHSNTFHQIERLPPLDLNPDYPYPIVAAPAEPLLSEQPVEVSTPPNPPNPGRQLTVLSVTLQRIIFILMVILVNLSLAAATIFGKRRNIRLAFIVLFKAKDYICVVISIFTLIGSAIRKTFNKPPVVPRQWILSLIPTYNESEEQILKCISSLRDNELGNHRQILVVIMDGKPKQLRRGMSRVVFEDKRPYQSLKYTTGQLHITAGWLHQTAAILIEKAENCGKKDSLVLCHDLFNFPRDNIPSYSWQLREEMWKTVLPALIEKHWKEFKGFNGVFCTDADSNLGKGCLRLLMEALARDKNAIAAAGTVFVELEPGFEWSFWNLHQQFQYTFSQFVRRRAEGHIGKVTCLPGCVTMIAVRKEMAGAIQKYAGPVTSKFVLKHQVQNLARSPDTTPPSLSYPAPFISTPLTYHSTNTSPSQQGTDRRLTYVMLSQGHNLSTLFVPKAVSETVAPQSLKHYLSQRRRWGSNSYFNSYFYLGGEKMSLIIRVAAASDTARQTFVYCRVLNTIFFISSLIWSRREPDILLALIAGQLPLAWYAVCLFIEPELRRRAHKLVIGLVVSKLVSPSLAIIVFTLVLSNLGNHAWGVSGVTATSTPPTVPNPSPSPKMAERNGANPLKVPTPPGVDSIKIEVMGDA